jgi:putative phage-type endonuclease
MKEDRSGYIGASDCAAVLGLSRFKTVLQVWAEKTGTVEPEDISEKLNVWLGNELEEIVAKKFTKDTGKKVHRVNDAYIHKNHDFIRCHIDRKVEGENAILQCKTASAWMAKHWEGEEIPQEYILQEYHELACSGYEKAYIAVLIGNNDFKIKVLERD